MAKKANVNSQGVSETPLMQQYYAIKAQHPSALLLFRVGDFYETFSDDAVTTAKVLGIVLTRRANGAASSVELAGFPHHALDTYLPKLVRAGYRVAICDQLEDPKLTKKLVKRGVTELISPGVAYSDKILDHKSNNFLAALILQNETYGLAFIDVSTGEFMLAQGNEIHANKVLQNFPPSELLISKAQFKELKDHSFISNLNTYALEDWVFQKDYSTELLLKQFNASSLKGFGVDEMPAGIIAAGAILHYLADSRQDKLPHITQLSRIEPDNFVWIDRFTARNLELVTASSEQGCSLLQIVDQTVSPMGARLIKRWLLLPLKHIELIEERHRSVEFFIEQQDILAKCQMWIKQMGDLERLIAKVAVGKVNPREICQVKKSLEAIGELKLLLSASKHKSLLALAEKLNSCQSLISRIETELLPEPAVALNKGSVMASGINSELDELREISQNGKGYLLKLQEREAQATGITSLKVAFNNVFGYYIEVSNTHRDKVPPTWIRKQTLVNAERYITEELKGYEEKILGAEEKILSIESALFSALVVATGSYTEAIKYNAAQVAMLDCLLSFAQVALSNEYTKPEINDSKVLQIIKGRHPVIEKMLPPGQAFVANDLYLDTEQQQIIMITGPNMSGKSALLRQTALIVLLAQIGSFVPAQSASIGLVDKIFTRVGASDNISQGESTFMVEMTETASILNNLSDRSLILLDEIGRGTSTYDGISIAWAIAEYLHRHAQRPKTLFATHYHELNDMCNNMERIKNFHVAVKEIDNRVLFLRKLVPGGSEHSFGIHVAQMAGIPAWIVKRAGQLLVEMENMQEQKPDLKALSEKKNKDFQLSFFQLDDPLLEQIRDEILNIQIDILTPVEALMKLNDIKNLLKKKK